MSHFLGVSNELDYVSMLVLKTWSVSAQIVE